MNEPIDLEKLLKIMEHVPKPTHAGQRHRIRVLESPRMLDAAPENPEDLILVSKAFVDHAASRPRMRWTFTAEVAL